MSKRLQVLLDEPEYRRVMRIARARGMSVSEWVRHALREAGRDEPTTDRNRKIAVIRAAAACSFPSGEIGDMLADIDSNIPM
ncbi:MAG TPA: CopG family transcriptional regulator [Kofleriaceae bacterium]|nr:CopG family transcriptional regulator [Kofleriaceae bacterium]